MRSTPQKGKPTGAGTTAGSKTKRTHALIVGQVADGLALTTTSTEARIDSRLISRQLGNKHKAVQTLLDRYLSVFKQHGQLTFKKEVGERKQGGGNAERYALLNENQAYLLLNLSRNTPTVVALKSKLITAFSEARRAADLRHAEYLPGYHIVHDRIKALAAGSPRERFDHMNINKLVNKVAGIEAGQRAAATVPKQGLLIVSQMLIAAAIQPAKDNREAYRLAARALQPLASAVLALQPGQQAPRLAG
jgi:phage regulator Rha-like protein